MDLEHLEKVIKTRSAADVNASYTAQLLAQGVDKCAEKFGEEAVEMVIAAVRGEGLVEEAADVLFHFLVVLQAGGVTLDDVKDELERRQSQSGIAEKNARAGVK